MRAECVASIKRNEMSSAACREFEIATRGMSGSALPGESTTAAPRSSSPPAPARRISPPAPGITADQVLESAELLCRMEQRGSIRYRECRARQQARLREECVRLNAQSAVEVSTDQRRAYCDAADRWRVVES